jgi:hypothetical protein
LEEAVLVFEKAIFRGEEEDLIVSYLYTSSLVMPYTRVAPM